jgi:hypothetical protein
VQQPTHADLVRLAFEEIRRVVSECAAAGPLPADLLAVENAYAKRFALYR